MLPFFTMNTAQNAGELPLIADGVEHQLDPRVIGLWRLQGWIVTAWLSGALLIALFVLSPNNLRLRGALALGAVWMILSAALAWLHHHWPVISYRHIRYRVDDQGIEIGRGVYWRKIINVPRSRVQHTDVAQGPLERRYGLGTLVIYTAGTDHAKVELDGLAHARALRIREHLFPREQDDAV